MLGFLKNRGSKDAKATAPKARKGKDGFYMEADESHVPASENGNQSAPAEAVKVEAAPAPAPAPAPEPAKAEAPAAAAEPAKDKKSAAKSKRAKALASAAATQEKKVEAAPKPAPAQPAVAPTAAVNGKAQPEAIKTFAPDYLLTLSSTNGRRRPGANMNSFLQMARQVKTR